MSNASLIAIVDDDEAIREALSDLLQVMGFPWRSFSNAESFLAAHAPARFSCVIADVKMPGMSGLELQRRLRVLDASIPVIIITSNTDPAARASALQDGAHAYLNKPVADEMLLLHLQAALHRNTDSGK